MSTDDDDELRAGFDALRDHDLRFHPDFADVVYRRKADRSGVAAHYGAWVRWAAAAVFVVAGALWIATTRGADDRGLDARVATITTWQSPTAGLLETPAQQVLSPPALLSSVLDGVTLTAHMDAPTKTD